MNSAEAGVEDASAGATGIEDIVDPSGGEASDSAAERSWAAPVVQTLRLTSGPSSQRDEPPSAPLN